MFICKKQWFLALPFILLVTLFYISNKATITPGISITTVYVQDHQATAAAELRSHDKTILFYTPYWDLQDFGLGFGKKPFKELKCPINNCFATNNRTLLGKDTSAFDAILFHHANIDWFDLLLLRRSPHQRFVFFNKESPSLFPLPKKQSNQIGFNWTMTYRLDSDIPFTYGYLQPKDQHYHYPPGKDELKPWKTFNRSAFLDYLESSEGNYLKKLAFKPNKALWVASECDRPSKREEVVALLNQNFTVDVAGKCGTFWCGTRSTWYDQNNCEANYKFYLSLENSFCQDYVTEKLFFRLSQNVIPIVWGAARYEQIAPPHSYIDALSFDSPGALAQFLHDLSNNHTEYLSYFWWRQYYNVFYEPRGVMGSFCRLCEMLNNPTLPTKIYSDLENWWSHPDKCYVPKYFDWNAIQSNVTKLRKDM